MNGMDDNDDEHNFSEDGLDALEDTALHQLEHNAILSTQQARTHFGSPPRQVPFQPRPTRAVPSKPILQAQANQSRPLLQDDSALQDEYDDDSFEWIGDDRVPTPVEEVPAFIPQRKTLGESTQREQWRIQRFGNPPTRGQAPAQSVRRPQHTAYQQPQYNTGVYNGNYQHPQQGNGAYGGHYPRQAPQAARPAEPAPAPPLPAKNEDRNEGLLPQIENLTKERDKLMSELEATKSQVMTQKGEIAIIRDNKNKETKVLDRQMTAVKKSMQEELAKTKVAMEALAERNKKVASDNTFLKHELDQEAERSRALKLRMREGPADRPTGPTTTPRKGNANSLRDGFDDDEVMVVSPVKSGRQSKPPTPQAAGKKKRKADVQSPIKPLVLRQSTGASDAAAAPSDEMKVPKAVPTGRRDRRTERHLRFMQKILNYKLRSNGLRLIEDLMKYSFPSDSKHMFSSIVLDGTASLAGSRLPADFLQIFLELWSRSIKEKYYDCIAVLLEVVDYIIDIDMSVIDKPTITALLPVLQDSISVNAEIRFKHSPVFHKNQNVGRPTPQAALNHDINGTSCLDLLYKTACIISSDFPLVDHFWRSLSTDFILMLLNPWQPISDITLVFSLLSTSIFPNTFGNICADQVTQTKMETYILDRICYMLWEAPKVDETLAPPSKPTIAQFRLAAMSLLSHLAVMSSAPPHDDGDHHGSLLLATHPSAIARLVRSLYDSVAALYKCPSAELTTLYSKLVNDGVRLLYHLTTLHADRIDLAKKLAAVNGGVQKHRVVLTRLAFSEGWYVDREVSDETVGMATAMLEENVTPDEAETLIEAFPGFTGRKRHDRDAENAESMELDGEPGQGKD